MKTRHSIVAYNRTTRKTQAINISNQGQSLGCGSSKSGRAHAFDREVMGSNNAGCWDRLLLSFTGGVSLIRSSLTVSCERKNGCLAVLPGAKQAK